MEWQDIIQYGLIFGGMFLMMRFGGCCGGKQTGKEAEPNGQDSVTRKKSCH